MGPKRRFIRITSELVLIRETHRTVLQWMWFEGSRVELSSVTLTPRCLAACATALSEDTFYWSNESGSLRVRTSGDCLELCFRLDGGTVEKTILLNGEEGRVFIGATRQFADRNGR
jgi:hypothetical protein